MFSGNHPQISYCDIAAKAAECGKKELSIRLLESEMRISKQVPLLVKLGQVSTALKKVSDGLDRRLRNDLLFQLCLGEMLHESAFLIHRSNDLKSMRLSIISSYDN